MLTFAKLQKEYNSILMTEVTDKQQAKNMENSMSSTTWVAGEIEGTGWTQLAVSSGTCFVCKNSLLN